MITRSEYGSGLRIVTERMPGVRSVTLGVWVSVGSRDEPDRIAGASHFLEHLLFKGTRTRSAKDIAEAFDAVGGDLNAFTGREQTTYYARILDQDLPMAVEHMCDMLQDSLLRPRDFDAERQVILEEINMNEDSPDSLIHDVFAETLWGGHPLGRSVLGTTETVVGVNRDQVRRFWKRHYTPETFVVVAAGNVEHDQVEELVGRWIDLGPRVEAERTPARPVGEPPQPTGGITVRRRPTEQAHICVGTAGLPRGDDRRFAFAVANNAVGEGMSSRLFQEVREQRGLAYAVYSYHSMYAETGLYSVYAGTTPGRAREVLEVIRRVLDSVAEDGLSPEELQRAKGHLKGSLVLSQEDTNSRMNRLGKSEISHGEILSVDEVIERVEAVTAEEAHDVAAEVLARPRSLAVIGPFDEDAEEFGGAARSRAARTESGSASGPREEKLSGRSA